MSFDPPAPVARKRPWPIRAVRWIGHTFNVGLILALSLNAMFWLGLLMLIYWLVARPK